MSNIRKMILSVIGFVVSTALLIISAVFMENSVVSPNSATILMSISIVLLFIAILCAAKVDYETGVYECRKCGNVFKPTFKAFIFGAHTLTTRNLKCPKCEECSWCKRKMIK